MSTDLCAAALLKDLAVLDNPPKGFTRTERRALLRSAKETLAWLLAAGGGPFELDVLGSIEAALDAALEAS